MSQFPKIKAVLAFAIMPVFAFTSCGENDEHHMDHEHHHETHPHESEHVSATNDHHPETE